MRGDSALSQIKFGGGTRRGQLSFQPKLSHCLKQITNKPGIRETMSGRHLSGGWRSKILLVFGCAIGVLIGVHLVHDLILVSSGNVAADLFEASSGKTLRVLQSVGILLPLFTGLLRFTTSDRSDVSEQVNDYLLLGILGLVLAGASAVIAGMSTTMTGILKLSLLFVLFTFIVIGLAAGAMFGEFATETDSDEAVTKENDVDDETYEDTGHSGLENGGDGASAKEEVESPPEQTEEGKQAEDGTAE